MNPIDDELAKALDEPPDAARDSQSPLVTPPRSVLLERPLPKRNLGLLISLLLGAGALVALVLSFRDAAVYAKTVDQLIHDKTRLTGRAVRVEGILVKGSLGHQEQPCEYRFRMANAGEEVPVRYANCVVPDTFRDVPGMDVKVTVEGKLSPQGLLEASLVMAKCPSKYEMKDRASQGEQAPHAPLPIN